MRKLYRSRKNRILLGICGGLAQYWEIDPTLVRFLFVLILFFTGIIPLLLCYLVAGLVIPLGPTSEGRSTYRKLFRSKTDRKIAGICGGVAKLLKADPTLIRLIAVFLCIFTGIFPLVFFYLIAWAIIPEE